MARGAHRARWLAAVDLKDRERLHRVLRMWATMAADPHVMCRRWWKDSSFKMARSGRFVYDLSPLATWMVVATEATEATDDPVTHHESQTERRLVAVEAVRQ